AETFAEDLRTCGVPSLAFPERESDVLGRAHAEPESLRLRLQAAQILAGPSERRPRVVVSSLLSLLQPVPAPKELERKLFHLQVGAHLDVAQLFERLIEAGYTRAPLAERPGELS